MITDIFAPLVMTLALEVPIAALWGLRRKDLLLCVMVNLLTNPLANLLYLLFPMLWVPAVLECAVVAAEGIIYRKLGERIKRPLSLSVTANLVSFLLGTILIFFLAPYFRRWF